MDITDLAKRMWFLRQRKERLEASLAETNKELNHIKYTSMPEMFERQEVDKISLDLSIPAHTRVYNAGKEIAAVDTTYVRELVRSHNCDEVWMYPELSQAVTIYSQVQIDYKNNQELIFEWLRSTGNQDLIKPTAHHKSVAGLIKEYLQEGQEVPAELEAKFKPVASIRKR